MGSCNNVKVTNINSFTNSHGLIRIPWEVPRIWKHMKAYIHNAVILESEKPVWEILKTSLICCMASWKLVVSIKYDPSLYISEHKERLRSMRSLCILLLKMLFMTWILGGHCSFVTKSFFIGLLTSFWVYFLYQQSVILMKYERYYVSFLFEIHPSIHPLTYLFFTILS